MLEPVEPPFFVGPWPQDLWQQTDSKEKTDQNVNLDPCNQPFISNQPQHGHRETYVFCVHRSMGILKDTFTDPLRSKGFHGDRMNYRRRQVQLREEAAPEGGG